MIYEFMNLYWSSLVLILVIFSCLSFFIKKVKKDINIALILVFFILSILLSFNALWDYYQSESFKKDYVNKRFHEVRGKISNLKKYNGKDVFFVKNVRFEILYRDSQCLSGKGLVYESQNVRVKYIKIKSLGNYVKRCIISI